MSVRRWVALAWTALRRVSRVASKTIDRLATVSPDTEETIPQIVTRRCIAVVTFSFATAVTGLPSLHPRVSRHVSDTLRTLAIDLWKPLGGLAA